MRLASLALGAAALLLAACSSTQHRAPVEQRGSAARPAVVAKAPTGPAPEATAADATPVRPLAPGSYVVKAGDTLIRIGLENGQNWRDIARWSGIENPNQLEVGQVLRVLPPEPVAGAAVAQPVAPVARNDSKPLPASSAAGPATAAAAPAATASTASTASTAANPAPKDGDDDLSWQWPASGPVIRGFDEARSKGVAIGGQAGEPVLAAADGRVVYAGSGLRGYGNLVIVKHNATFLSAYAHNQTLLVKEDQAVRRGQKIAEMGASDADRVQLHFEIRRLGKPVDPTRYLPPR